MKSASSRLTSHTSPMIVFRPKPAPPGVTPPVSFYRQKYGLKRIMVQGDGTGDMKTPSGEEISPSYLPCFPGVDRKSLRTDVILLFQRGDKAGIDEERQPRKRWNVPSSRPLPEVAVGSRRAPAREGVRSCSLAVQRRSRDGTYCVDEMSLTWLHRATKRSKKSWVPPLYISSCMVPLRLKVPRERMMRAR